MTNQELKPYFDRLSQLCNVYESTFQLTSEHTPEGCIIDYLNSQFRAVLDDLDSLGVLS